MTQTAVSALQIKKQGLGTLAITDRGDRIRTCDLVLPKQWVVEVITTKRTQAETRKSVDTGTIIQDKIDLNL
jgi:hypothetical protein